jgi:cytochrome c
MKGPGLVAVVLGVGAWAAAASGCHARRSPPVAAAGVGGDPARGEQVIRARNCGACHDIPDVTGAHGRVGPPLAGFALRTFIAGELPNAPDNLIRWIRDPHSVEPRTAMPVLGLDEADARDVAAFLYTLDREN